MPESAVATAPPPAAPAPAAPPPPASPPAAPTAPAADKPSWLDDVGKDFDQADDGAPVTKAPEKANADDLAKTGVVVPPKKPDDQPPPKPHEAPARPVKAAELRTAYDNLKKEKREVLEPKIQQLEAKLKELEARQPEDTKPLLEKMTATEKRNAELESHIQFVDYQRSKEFQEKYATPFRESWDRAVSDFSQLTVRVNGGVTMRPASRKSTNRAATAEISFTSPTCPLGRWTSRLRPCSGSPPRA